MITLFKSNETDFSHNGIGNLDYHIMDPVVEEEINGLYSFSFKYPLFAPHGLEIEGESIVRVPVPEMEEQLFRVYRHVKSMGYITVSCFHIFYDLADNFIEDTNIVEKDGQGAIQQLGGATQFDHDFRFFSDIQTVANARLVRKNVVASILDDQQANSFVSRWGGELIRNNFDVRMNQSAGSDRGFTVKYRKNLTGYEADVDDSTVITRIMPKGFDGLLLPEKYVDSPLIDNYVRPKIKMIDYNDVKASIGEYADDEDAIPLEDAYAELRRLAKQEYTINKIDIPTVSYKVNFVTLDQTEEYKDLEDLQQLKMGDMVTVDHEDDNFKVTAKLVKYKYDPIAERYLSAELGSIHDGITTRYTDINTINRKVDEVIERTNIIQATADGKNTIHRGGSEPVNPNLRDLWYKPNGNETEMYQYVEEDGQKYWKLIADTGDVTKVQKDVNEALEDAQTAKNTADLAMGNVIEAFDEIDSLSTIVDENTGEISTIKHDVIGLQTTVTGPDGIQSQITQLSKDINLRVEKGDVINQINISDEDILISGKKLILDGDTTVTGTFRVSDANITSVDAGKMTTGTLDAGQVNIINLNASNITSGTLEAIDITGGRITQLSSGGRVEMYNGKIQSYRRDELALEIADYKIRFYNSDATEVGSIYPITSLVTGDKGIGFGVENDSRIGIGVNIGGVLYPSLEINPINNNTYLAGSYNGLIAGSTLGLYANRRLVSADVDVYAYDQPSIIMTQGSESNNMTQYFGGYNRRSGATWQVRWRKSQTTSIRRIEAHDGGVHLQGTVTGSSSLSTLLGPNGRGYYENGTGSNSLNRDGALEAGGIVSSVGHFYLGTRNGSELRVTDSWGRNGDGLGAGQITYRDVRASNFINTSSIKYKTNVADFEDQALDIINGLKVVNYNLKDELERGINKTHVGFISEHNPSIATDDQEAIDTYKLSSIQTKAIQELGTKVNKHMESTALKFAELEQRLQKLEVA